MVGWFLSGWRREAVAAVLMCWGWLNVAVTCLVVWRGAPLLAELHGRCCNWSAVPEAVGVVAWLLVGCWLVPLYLARQLRA
jgi:hypothetical protein